eukprot:GEMP01058026.1.p2 GENE.GEMP01058026.1~~GEMP01058026.1.p2  ORF type:complete len:105 (+),score=15.93 GEMP01058026.1:214-528(+)
MAGERLGGRAEPIQERLVRYWNSICKLIILFFSEIIFPRDNAQRRVGNASSGSGNAARRPPGSNIGRLNTDDERVNPGSSSHQKFSDDPTAGNDFVNRGKNWRK